MNEKLNRNSLYFKQVQLVVRIIPHIAEYTCFALKGGTALNLFIRDFPRLSVDIDLSYLPREPRDLALANIHRELKAIGSNIEKNERGIKVQYPSNSLRLKIKAPDCEIKVELSPVLRGSVFPVETLEVKEQVEDIFGYAAMQVLSANDLYAGKICAALDRQHPRDLFDIKLLLDNEGISRALFQTFLVYLISHNRPVAELLAPRRLDIGQAFHDEFSTMSRQPVSLETLLDVREKLIGNIGAMMEDTDKQFLLSFKAKRPDWSLLGLSDIQDLPAVKWKLLNLNRMAADKHQRAFDNLEMVLGAFT
jgi:predicted nucleotidyltransferase component of viral defense system